LPGDADLPSRLPAAQSRGQAGRLEGFEAGDGRDRRAVGGTLDGASFGRVRVAVPGPLRRLWSYSVPLGLRDACRPGARVLVPFGGRRVTGVVVGIEPDPPAETDPAYEVKPVERVLDEVPALDPDLLELTRWASEYYGASWGEMIRTALPGQQATLRLEVSLTIAGREAIGAASAPPRGEDRRALAAVAAAASEGAFVSLAAIRRRNGFVLTAGR